MNTLLYSYPLNPQQQSKSCFAIHDKGSDIMFFYGGEVHCMLGKMKIENMDKILDIMDLYIELKEAVDNKKENIENDRSSKYKECAY